MTLPDEGPEQRWRRTVRKRPAKLKLGRLLRDFGYSELDDDVADAIEARMAGVGLAIRPPLREAAADEIVTVYRPQGVDDDAAAAAAAATPRPREPAAPAASERPRPKSGSASDPDSTRAISDLKGQLTDARAESARLRAELDGRIAAMADADRRARERHAEQTMVVEEQAHRLAELSGLLNETRAALAEARDEIRRALGDLPAAVVEAPVEVGGLSEEEGWLTDADEPLPPSPVEAAVSAIASPVDELPAASEAPLADDDDLVFEPELPAAAAEVSVPEAPAEDDVFSLEADAPSVEDGFSLDEAAPPAEEDELFSLEAEAPAEEDVFSLEGDAPPDEDVFSLESEAPQDDDVFGPLTETSPEDDGLPLETEPAPETIVRPAAPARRSGFFTLEPTPPPPDDVPVSEADPPPASADAAPEEELAPDDEWRLDDDAAPAETPAEPADRPAAGVSAEADDLTFATTGDDVDKPAPGPAPEPAAWIDDAPSALPPPPPLPASPFADELPARPPEPGELPSRQPAKRGRMARGRGRWQGTCSVCERFPEVSRRKDLEAAGWQLDGDFPTCPQCRGLA